MKNNCPKKKKTCKSCLLIKSDKKNYICSGVSIKPTKYIEDKIHLCLSGILGLGKVEMTKDEVALIISALSMSLGKILSNE